MSEITEQIKETLEQAKASKLNSFIAIMVAISATIMAICNIKDGNIVQAMSQAQAHSLDAWSYYQAKSIKQNMIENNMELLTTTMEEKGNNKDTKVQEHYSKLMEKYEKKIKQYEKDKADLKAKAQGFEAEYEALNIFDDQFDMTEALISIGIALFGIASLTQKKWLFYFATTISIVGMIFGLSAFLKIEIHPEWLAKILG